MSIKYPKEYCIAGGTDKDDGGMFIVPFKDIKLYIIASHGGKWDHVSVSLNDRCPTWEEMCFVKDLFFEEPDCVIQYHPPNSEYINTCENALHMWRPQDLEIPMPPVEFV